MRAITKGAEPASLTAHRLTPHSDYENYSDKSTLRHALVTEQRGLCCYCLSRIRNGDSQMKVEHWQSQTKHPGEQLSYRNLLGACMGGQGQLPNKQHCDTRKGDRAIQWNPADPAHHIETRVRYEDDGSLRSDNATFNKQIDDVLNLNLQLLKNNRKAILDAILQWWREEKARISDAVPEDRFERERLRYIVGNGEITPYCAVAVWWLEKRLEGMRK